MKVVFQVLVFAFLVVLANTLLVSLFLLYGLDMRDSGWTWSHGFLFATMVASTDAVAVTAILKQGINLIDLVLVSLHCGQQKAHLVPMWNKYCGHMCKCLVWPCPLKQLVLFPHKNNSVVNSIWFAHEVRLLNSQYVLSNRWRSRKS